MEEVRGLLVFLVLKFIACYCQGGWNPGRPGSQVDGWRYATAFGQSPYVPENARLEDPCMAGRCDAQRPKPEDPRLAGFLENAEPLFGWRKDPCVERFVENAKSLCRWRKDTSMERFFQDAESILRWRWWWWRWWWME